MATHPGPFPVNPVPKDNAKFLGFVPDRYNEEVPVFLQGRISPMEFARIVQAYNKIAVEIRPYIVGLLAASAFVILAMFTMIAFIPSKAIIPGITLVSVSMVLFFVGITALMIKSLRNSRRCEALVAEENKKLVGSGFSFLYNVNNPLEPFQIVLSTLPPQVIIVQQVPPGTLMTNPGSEFGSSPQPQYIYTVPSNDNSASSGLVQSVYYATGSNPV